MIVETIRPKVEILNISIGNQNLDLSPFLLRVTTNMQSSQPAGTFQIDFVPDTTQQLPGFSPIRVGSFLEKAINKGDIISIGFKKKGTFLGRIEAFQKSKLFGEKPNSTITVTGRNLGGLLLDDDIVFAPELAINDRAKELLGKDRVQFLGIIRGAKTKDKRLENIFYDNTPIVPIVWILLNMPSLKIELDYKNYNFNADLQEVTQKKLGNFFCTDLNIYRDQQMYDDVTLTQYAGKVWNYFVRCLDPIFYEIYVDTVMSNPDNPTEQFDMPRPCIVIRPKPFDREVHIQQEIAKSGRENSDVGHYAFKDFDFTKDEEGTIFPDADVKKFKSLKWAWDNHTDKTDFLTRITRQPFHTISKEEVLDESSASNIIETCNYYIMKSTKDILANSELAQYGYLFPLIDAYSVQKYGMKKLEANTNLLKVNTVDLNKVSPDILGGETKKDNSVTEYITIPEQYTYMRDKLFYWYRYNPILLQSQKKIFLNEDIRIGDKVYFPDETFKQQYQGFYYYVEGVTNTWEINENGNPALTILTLSRGENPDMIADYDKLAKYDIYDSGNINDSNIIKINYEQTNKIDAQGEKKEGVKTVEEKEKNQNLKSGTKEKTVSKNVAPMTKAAEKIVTSLVNTYMNKMAWKFASGVSGKVGWSAFGINDPKDVINEINKAGQSYGIDPNFIVALIWQESSFDPFAVSETGCSGLGQFEMQTARPNKYFQETMKKEGVQLYKQGNHTIKNINDVRFYPFTSIWAIPECLVTDKHFNISKPSTWASALQGYIGKADYSAYLSKLKKINPNTELK